jgi:hypothetical protein
MAKADPDYFEWLTAKIEIPESNPHTYNGLFRRLHEVEFVWHVSGDGNRVQDGRDLRTQFMNETRRRRSPDLDEIMHVGATVLEVVIALSIRTAFTAGGVPEIWAWQLLENLNLHRAHDPLTQMKANRVDEILEALIWRTYNRDGQGGFFPLSDDADSIAMDQTKLEIWDQMNIYVNEIQEL